MEPSLSNQIDSILKEFQVYFERLREKQADLIKRIRKTIDGGKLKRIKKELGMPE
jgi:hypothetical protein